MKFQYKAIDQIGTHKEGLIESPTEDIALVNLQTQGLVVTDIKEVKPIFQFGKPHVSLNEVSFFSRQLGVLISARVSVTDALKSISKSTKNFALQETVFSIVNDLSGGLIFSKALARHQEMFSQFYVEMIASSEATGSLAETLNYLADYYETQSRLMAKFKSALIYPVIVVVIALVALIVVFGFVIPQIGNIFQQSGIPIPFLTSVFLAISSVLINFWWAIIIGAAVGGYVFYEYARSREGREMLDYVIISIPIFGDIFKKLYIARFLESFRTLIGGGIPIDRALTISAAVTENKLYAKSIAAATEEIKAGKKISESLAHAGGDIFTPLVIQLIETGEATGELSTLVGKASQFYQEETSRSFDSLTEVVQAGLIVCLGGLLGLMEAAILIPIFTLTQNLGNL